MYLVGCFLLTPIINIPEFSCYLIKKHDFSLSVLVHIIRCLFVYFIHFYLFISFLLTV